MRFGRKLWGKHRRPPTASMVLLLPSSSYYCFQYTNHSKIMKAESARARGCSNIMLIERAVRQNFITFISYDVTFDQRILAERIWWILRAGRLRGLRSSRAWFWLRFLCIDFWGCGAVKILIALSVDHPITKTNCNYSMSIWSNTLVYALASSTLYIIPWYPLFVIHSGAKYNVKKS
jgi:hypothetical protein